MLNPLLITALIIVVFGAGVIIWLCHDDRRLIAFNAIVLSAIAHAAVVIIGSAGSTGSDQSTGTDEATWWSVLGVAAVITALIGVNRVAAQRFAELREASAQAAQREQRLGQAAELARLGYYYYDTEAERIVDCTEQHARNHGVSIDEYLEMATTLSNEMPLIHPDDRRALADAYEEVLAGDRVEVTYRVPSGDYTIHVKEITQPVWDGDRIIGEIGTTMDITDQVIQEKQLLLSQKLETTGRISAGVAHDFNNLLNVILLSLESLDRDLGSGQGTDGHGDQAVEEQREKIRIALDAVDRGSGLAERLQSFARQSDLRPEVLDLNESLRRTREWSAGVVPATIGFEMILADDLWPVVADPGLTESTVLNLILNAAEAMPDGGRLTLETANILVDDSFVKARQESIEPGRYAMVAVTDTGRGIASSDLEQIFEPFYSTKESIKGSGLGLSTVLGFMKQSGGTVRVYSEPGVGTSFKLYFPSAEPDSTVDGAPSQPATAQASTEATSAPHPGIRLLLAEDEEGIRTASAEALTELGYQVVVASSGDEAYDLFAADPNFDLLITDIVMPGSRSGPDLARAVRALSPDLPVIFISGYPTESTVHSRRLNSGDIRLQKPFRVTELAALIEGVSRPKPTPGGSPVADSSAGRDGVGAEDELG